MHIALLVQPVSWSSAAAKTLVAEVVEMEAPQAEPNHPPDRLLFHCAACLSTSSGESLLIDSETLLKFSYSLWS